MRKLFNLYLSYLKTSMLAMLVAAAIFPLYAAIYTGKLSIVLASILLVVLLFLLHLSSKFLSRPANFLFSPFIVKQIDPIVAAKTPEEERATFLTSVQYSQIDHKRSAGPVGWIATHRAKAQAMQEEILIREALQGINADSSSQEALNSTLPFTLVKPSNDFVPSAKIKVVGIGGGGNNAVSWMVDAGVVGVEFLAVNTDLQALKYARAHRKLQIGSKATRGLGVGGDPNIGRQAALEDTNQIVEVLKGLDMVFLTAGLGGGTGTGAIPVFAKIAKKLGVLTVAVITKPFSFEGHVRKIQAEEGLMELQDHVDTLITIENDRLLTTVNEETPLVESFRLADDVLRQAVQGISDIITVPGLINVDYADVKTIISGKGVALMGTGRASGLLRSIRAVKQVVTSPLLGGESVGRAKDLLINITGSEDLTLHEVSEAMMRIQQIADPEANIIFGAVINEELTNEINITVIATGFQDKAASGEENDISSHRSKSLDQDEISLVNFKRKKAN